MAGKRGRSAAGRRDVKLPAAGAKAGCRYAVFMPRSLCGLIVPGPDKETLRLMIKDLGRTIQTQISTGEHIDEKAARIIGWDGLLLGLGLTGASLSLRDGDAAPNIPFLSLLMGSIGLLAILISVFQAINAYRATEYHPGLKSNKIVEALAYEVVEEEHLEIAIQDYADAIDKNKTSIDQSSNSFGRSLWAFFFALFAIVVATIPFIYKALP